MCKVILADNQSIFRAGAARVISLEQDMHLIAQCPTGESLLSILPTHRESVVLYGSSLKLHPEATALNLSKNGHKGVAILENHETNDDYFRAHWYGAIYRSITPRGLVDIVRKVANGERVMQAMRSVEADVIGMNAFRKLTPKERKVTAYIACGRRNKEIAMLLQTSEQVIKNHMRSIYDKTGTSDRFELGMFVMNNQTLAAALTQSIEVVAGGAN